MSLPRFDGSDAPMMLGNQLFYGFDLYVACRTENDLNQS